MQRDCIEFALNAKPIHRHMPKDRKSYAYKVWRIVTSTPFEFIIMVLIIVNTIVLMMEASLSFIYNLLPDIVSNL